MVNNSMPATMPALGDISVQRLIDDSLLALSREVKNLLVMSAKGKLGPSDARDLRDHVKLLFELKDREKDSLKNLSDEQLRAILNEREQNSGISGSGIETVDKQEL